MVLEQVELFWVPHHLNNMTKGIGYFTSILLMCVGSCHFFFLFDLVYKTAQMHLCIIRKHSLCDDMVGYVHE
jgi:hypothetical protein